MSIAQRVIHMSHDAIICINNYDVIETIYQGVPNILGYILEQMLGQNINVLDCLNMKLNSNLQLRVGDNCGGPILAGVLGYNKPAFDIIGDTINIAARLQTSDVPGKVQISKAKYNIFCDCNFNIEEHGEIFFKVKVQQLLTLFSLLIQIILSLLILKVNMICDFINIKM